MSLPQGLAETLEQLAEALAELRSEWWLIGSAAMALHGARPVIVADVDVLASAADARLLAARLGVSLKSPAPDARFRSEVHFRWDAPPLPVDVMGGFRVMTPQGWQSLQPRTRISVGGVFTPSVEEQLEILHLFGRTKDRKRAAVLRALIS